MQEVLFSALRAVLAYILAMVAARFIGRKSISQMTFSNFVFGVTLGSATANLALGPKFTPYSAATIIIVFALLAVLTAFINLKSFKGRKIMNSEPVVVVDKGQLVDENLRRARMTLNELSAMLREKNVFSMADVEFAIMETDGQLSVLPKAQKTPLSPSDMNIQVPYKELGKDLIIDGNIIAENLAGANKDEAWLLNELGRQGIKDVKKVFYAGLDTSGGLYVSVRKESKEEHGQYGIE